MATIEILRYLLIWGTIGAVLFSFFVIFVFRFGIVYTARNEEGQLKEKIPLTGYLTSGGFLILVVLFLVTTNYFGFYQAGYQMNIWCLYALNLVLYLIVFLFDTLVIDGFVIGY